MVQYAATPRAKTTTEVTSATRDCAGCRRTAQLSTSPPVLVPSSHIHIGSPQEANGGEGANSATR
jgi:hypothetical protein